MPTKKNTAKKAAPSKKGAVKASKKNSAIGLAPAGFLLVNMIPKALSAETHQDSEPHLTVNSTNPKQIIGTAFTRDPGLGPNAPIFVSTNGGATWLLNSIVPSAAGSSATGDITTSFNRNASKLYGAILRSNSGNQEFLRTSTPFTPPPMTILASRTEGDQPFTHATTVTAGADAGKDRLYIGNNNVPDPTGRSATIDHSLNAGVAAPVFNTVRVEKRATVGQDGPQVRPVAHDDGTVYAAFYRWRTLSGNFPANTLIITSAEVVVVRDDQGGNNANPYTHLLDPSDGLAGRRVATGLRFPFMIGGTAATGQQRIGGSLSLAVSPPSSSTIFLVYGDKPLASPDFLTLHVRRSVDRGVTWSADLLTLPAATNGAVAINSNGVVGLLYQQLKAGRWVTHMRRSLNNGATWDDLILADTSATNPVKTFDPYLGDYCHLLAVRADFYGIFSASNTPNPANFPNGVNYQRNANFVTQKLFKLDSVTVVPTSIDPFFFKLPS